MGNEKRKASWKPGSFSSSTHICNGESGTWLYPDSAIKKDQPSLRIIAKRLAESNKNMREMGVKRVFRRDSKCKCVLLKEIFSLRTINILKDQLVYGK